MDMKAMNLNQAVLAVGAILILTGGAAAQEARTDAVVQPPSRCTITTVYTKGNADNFQFGPDPRTPSPALQAFLAPLHPVDYDVDQPNHAFGDSFRLCACET